MSRSVGMMFRLFYAQALVSWFCRFIWRFYAKVLEKLKTSIIFVVDFLFVFLYNNMLVKYYKLY